MRSKVVTRAAMIAALYAAVTFAAQAVSFGMVQIRPSEALTALPILFADAVPGLTVGCLLSNLLAGAPWFDVVFGTLATLLGAMLTRRLRRRPRLAVWMPVLTNALITGPVVYFGYVWHSSTSVNAPALLLTVLSVAVGESIAAPLLGSLLLKAIPSKIKDAASR